MPIVTRHSLISVVAVAVASLAIVGVFVWSGIYNIGADDTHTKPVHSLLELLRERSITSRAKKLHPPPSLTDPASIRQGAGNYNAMCAGCHLAPGMHPTELSLGLYPSPPNLTLPDAFEPSHHFWVIKHGIKASGMPAWGKSMSDEYIWNMVAFLQELPRLDAAQYRAMVASSGGHSHGGGETMPHDDGGASHGASDAMDHAKPHDHPSPEGHHPSPVTSPTTKPAAEMVEHRHADGTVESHPAPPPPSGGDQHQHDH